jgi:DHA1 family multidrug resistance protein-like MFS transporter
VLRSRPRAALFGIVAAVFVSGTGIGSLLPILPLFLRERGASYSFVGVIVGAALVAQAVGQWPAGWLAERVGRREMMVAGLLIAAAASLMFLLPLPVEWLVVVRFIQGLGFAAAAPAEVAAVADVVPPEELGRAYGWVAAARQSGLIVGPAIGGLLAVFGRWTVFAVTGAALAAAALVAGLALARSVRSAPAEIGIGRVLLRSGRVGVALRAMVTLAVGLGLLIGIYDVIWSLYMRAIGASDFVIGLSFTLFALPLVIATPFAGWASDRWDRRWLAFGSVALGSAMALIYPSLSSIPIVMIVGALEATLWAFTEPSMNSFLMDAVPARRGEAQGVVGTATSGSMAVGALVGGTLFSMGLAVPFTAAAVAGVAFSLLALPSLRGAGRRAPVLKDLG